MTCATREQEVYNDYVGFIGDSPNPWQNAAGSELSVRTVLNNRGFTDVPCGTVANETCRNFVRRIGIIGTPGGELQGFAVGSGGYYGADGFKRGGG